MRTSTAIGVIIIVALLLGGLFWFTMQSSTTPVADNTPTPMPSGTLGLNGASGQTNTGQVSVPPVATVATSTRLKGFLVAQNGMTLYMFTKDATNTSNCKGQCAQNWPPYIVSTTESLVAGEGMTGLLSTIVREEGSSQLVYNGMPLYFFKKDKGVGDTTGQNMNKAWFVVKP